MNSQFRYERTDLCECCNEFGRVTEIAANTYLIRLCMNHENEVRVWLYDLPAWRALQLVINASTDLHSALTGGTVNYDEAVNKICPLLTDSLLAARKEITREIKNWLNSHKKPPSTADSDTSDPIGQY